VGIVIRYSHGLPELADSFVGRYGTVGQHYLGPSTHDFDFAMVKRFPLGKEERL